MKQNVMELIEEAVHNGARATQACETLGISIRNTQRWKASDSLEDQRQASSRIPANRFIEEERKNILKVLNSKEFMDKPPSQIVPILADRGEYLASESTMYRILRANQQLQPRGLMKPRRHKKPDAYCATQPNQVWTWDITYLCSTIKGQYFYLYLITDIYSRKIVGFGVHEKESAEYASLLIEDTCLSEGIHKDELVLHSDNGSPMKGYTMQATLEKLGVIKSYSRPSTSNDNPYSESLFRTLKYHPSYPKDSPFSSLQEAREWTIHFVYWYNTEHMHSGIKFVTPQDRHKMKDEEILKKRHAVYQAAREKNPKRWSGETRNWEQVKIVHLNPKKESAVEKMVS